MAGRRGQQWWFEGILLARFLTRGRAGQVGSFEGEQREALGAFCWEGPSENAHGTIDKRSSQQKEKIKPDLKIKHMMQHL